MTGKQPPNAEGGKVETFTSKKTAHDATLGDEDIQVACRRFAKQLGLKGPAELLRLAAEVFPRDPTYVVIGVYPNGKRGALLVEGESKEAAEQLLDDYLELLKKGAGAVADDPCGALFSALEFWPCLDLRLLTRCEVDAVHQKFQGSAR